MQEKHDRRKYIMPRVVSIFCGDGCTHHNRPQFEELLHASSRIVQNVEHYTSSCMNEPYLSSIWPDIHNMHVMRNTHFSGSISKVLCSRIKCEYVYVLTTTINKCMNGDCRENMHAIDGISTDPEWNRDLCNGVFCRHASNSFVKLAIDQHNIVISNDPYNDPRVKEYGKNDAPDETFAVKNLMVVPLAIHCVQDVRKIGAVLLMNKTADKEHASDEQPKCVSSGFNALDYGLADSLFYELAIYLDITHQGFEMQRLTTEIEVQQKVHSRQMHEVNTTRDTFIATMSHEIRTPLNAVNGYNEIMMRNLNSHHKVPADLLVNSLRRQRDGIFQLTNLIANILDFSKLKSHSLKLDSKPFSIRTCVDQVLGMVYPDCQQKNIELTHTVEDAVPETVIGDPTRVHQVISNLVSNAAKYTTHGFIDIHVGMVKHDGQEHGLRTVKIAVQDSGKGVPGHLQKKIFEDFHQIRDLMTPTVSVQGVGLGLAICKELVERLMGGKIWVESDGRNGSTFMFTMKVRDNEQIQQMVKSVHEVVGRAGVLIVDDLEVNRMLMLDLFVQWGFVPHSCSTIDEAMHIFHSMPDGYFRVAIIDMDLGNGESGLTLARRLAHDPKCRDDMILISASSLGTSFSGSSEFDSVHEKPVRQDDLLQDILRLIRSGPCRKNSHKSAVRTPRRNGHDENGENARESSSRRSKRQKKFVLIVDDDAPSREVLSEMLQSVGCSKKHICMASGSRDALAMLKRKPKKYKVVFMDLVMPDIDGIECTKIIVHDPKQYGEPTILAVSADALDSTRQLALNSGAENFLSKPVEMNVLELAWRQYGVCKKTKK